MPKRYAFLLGISIVLYVAMTLLTPPDPTSLERFGLSALQLQLLSLTLVLPLVAIWILAFYGFAKFKEYALRIKNNPDGRAFNTLANGLTVLAVTLPISSLISTALNYFSRTYPDLAAATAITNRYITLGLAAAAFILIYQGSKNLAALTPTKKSSYTSLWCGIAVLILGGLYVYLTLTNSAGQATYHLPVWLIITTITVPYIYIWYLGLKSAILILAYKRNVQGSVYKQALGSLAAGVGMVVAASIVVQLITALGNYLIDLGLQPLLALVYLLVIIIGIGFVLIAFGAKKLKKIEEV